MDEFDQFDKGSLFGRTDPQSDNGNRCFSQSRESPLQWQESTGPLDLTTGQDAYKCLGTMSSVEGLERLSPFPSPQRSIVSDGQHSSPILHK